MSNLITGPGQVSDGLGIVGGGFDARRKKRLLPSDIEPVVTEGLNELIGEPTAEEMAYESLDEYFYYCMQNIGHMMSLDVPEKYNPGKKKGKEWLLFSDDAGVKCFNWFWEGRKAHYNSKAPWDERLVSRYGKKGLAGYYYEGIATSLPAMVQNTPSHLTTDYVLEETWRAAVLQSIINAAKRCSKELREEIRKG